MQSLNSYMVRSLFGIIGTGEFDLMSTFPGMVFWILYFVFIVVIGLNGLISIMTLSLADNMSEGMVRQGTTLC